MDGDVGPAKTQRRTFLRSTGTLLLGALAACTSRISPTPTTAESGRKSERTTTVPPDSPASTAEPVPPGCSPPTAFPDKPWGGMTYVNWRFGKSGLSELRHDVEVRSDPGPNSNLYLQLYDAAIDGTGQYFGLQTTGRVIFSRFGTVDRSNIRTGVGYADFGTNEGPFVSLRWDRGRLPTGRYRTEVRRSEFDGKGDWFDYYVAFPGEELAHVGGIRFPRAERNRPASFADGGGTWTEFWPNSSGGTTVVPVPEWRVTVAIAADERRPKSATLAYGLMPNADIVASSDGVVDMALGGLTPRCTQPGAVRFPSATPTFAIR